MMIPNFVPGHDPHAEAFARPAESRETGLIRGIQLPPCAGKLLNMHLHVKVVFENLLQ